MTIKIRTGDTDGEMFVARRNVLTCGGENLDCAPLSVGVLAQLVEHHNGIVGVKGSNPLGSTIPKVFSFHCGFMAAMNFSITDESAVLFATDPTTMRPAAGCNGINFNRGPAMHARQFGTRATPRPISTAVIKLVTPSCSSAKCGLTLVAANSFARLS